MSEIEIWISDAVTSLGLRVERLADEDALITTEAVQLRFVDDPPRVWWLGLKTPYVYYEAESTRLSHVLPRSNGKVFFIPETDEDRPLPVYIVEAGDIEQLIGECTFFEYYVVDIDKKWLLAETEHDVFILCYEWDSSLRIAPSGKIWSS